MLHRLDNGTFQYSFENDGERDYSCIDKKGASFPENYFHGIIANLFISEYVKCPYERNQIENDAREWMEGEMKGMIGELAYTPVYCLELFRLSFGSNLQGMYMAELQPPDKYDEEGFWALHPFVGGEVSKEYELLRTTELEEFINKLLS